MNSALQHFGGLSPEIIKELDIIRADSSEDYIFFLVGLQAQRTGKTPQQLIAEWRQIVADSRRAQYRLLDLLGRVPFRP